MERFDAVVVGAGPAGSTTAFRLARAGARVCLLDRAHFPRDKPCGGGLTIRAVRQLPFAVDPVVEDTVDTVELGLGYRRRFAKTTEGVLMLMTQRRRLDAFLAERAAEAGAIFRDGVKVTAVEPGGIVTAGRERLQAEVVVGADGANGIAARSIGCAPPELGVAIEGNVSYRAVPRERYRGRAVVEVGVVAGGYAWVFPKGDHVNVGVGGWGREAPRLRERLRELCAAYAIDETQVRDVRGHRLPMGGVRRPPVRRRVLLVGDAAGLVDPLTGDGMFEAFVSGRLAADATLDLLAGGAGTLEPYGPALENAVGRSLSSSWRAKLALDRFPRIAYEIARLPPVWGFIAAVLRGELAHPGDANALARGPLRLVEALGRTR